MKGSQEDREDKKIHGGCSSLRSRLPVQIRALPERAGRSRRGCAAAAIRLDAKGRGGDPLAPALGTAPRRGEALPLAENKAAGKALRGLYHEALALLLERTLEVLEMHGHVLLADARARREIAAGQQAAEEGLMDGRARGDRSLGSGGGSLVWHRSSMPRRQRGVEGAFLGRPQGPIVDRGSGIGAPSALLLS